VSVHKVSCHPLENIYLKKETFIGIFGIERVNRAEEEEETHLHPLQGVSAFPPPLQE